MAPVVVYFGGKKAKLAEAPDTEQASASVDAVVPIESPVMGPLPSWLPAGMRDLDGVAKTWAAAHIIVPVGLVTGFASGIRPCLDTAL